MGGGSGSFTGLCLMGARGSFFVVEAPGHQTGEPTGTAVRVIA